MQPEPIETSTHAFTNSTLADSTNTSQYGFLPQQLQSAEVQHSSQEGHSGSVDHDRNSRPPSLDESGIHGHLRRLNLNGGNSYGRKPAFQRISDYENALSPSPSRNNEGPMFKVTKRRLSSSNGVLLENFPNEVLTHVLSHLPATTLASVSLVSRRFYGLVTTPHAWRIAFSRFFPGHDATDHIAQGCHLLDQSTLTQFRSEHRLFTRLTGLASWRSEYILRTRLLRSLARGKPPQLASGQGVSSRSHGTGTANAVITYSSQLFATVNHIHAVFGNGKRSPRFIHGSDETGSAGMSDPASGKIDPWGLADPQALPQFADLFVGEAMYGLGGGFASLPNSMDVSQPFGMVYGEGFPGGQTYFRSSEEQRGRFLSQPSDLRDCNAGIPLVPSMAEAISAVWIARSSSVPNMTNGLIGIMTGSTLGVVTAYSLGADSSLGRIIRGQLTSKWVISPGVPIIAIEVDDSFSPERKGHSRIWAVALNALGEVYFLTSVPDSSPIDARQDEAELVRRAWEAGRTAYWHLAEPSRRVARVDPYHKSEVEGSYSPRSSSHDMRLSQAQIAAETSEIESFFKHRPSHFRSVCNGWDMRMRLEVDFGGDDGKGAGEALIVIRCGLGEGDSPEIRRFTRWRSEQASFGDCPVPKIPPISAGTSTMTSLFGGGNITGPFTATSTDVERLHELTVLRDPQPSMSEMVKLPSEISQSKRDFAEEWRISVASFKDHLGLEITTTAIDMSTYALLTIDEDPILTNDKSSKLSAQPSHPSGASSYTQIPGERARFLAIGTNRGAVILFNMRSPQPPNALLVNELQAIRTIVTDSPQISCLAVSALFIVAGGNDGLVQAWDPLASTMQPIRTLNSRFSSRARRRLVQAEASLLGVGINLYAAGSIILDPDPTALRGMVSLGTHLRFWSYSSSAADQYQSKKRRLRRSGERGVNSGSDRFTNTGRGALMDYIATEQEELKWEKLRHVKEEARLRGRFGVGLGGLSEEEALRYAELVSAETFQKDEERRMGDGDSSVTSSGEGSSAAHSAWTSSATITPSGSIKDLASPPRLKTEDEFEDDIEEAIRLSLLDGLDEGVAAPRAPGSAGYDIPIIYKHKKEKRSASSSPSTSKAGKHRVRLAVSNNRGAISSDDLAYALQLSLVEDRSRKELTIEQQETDEFPHLQSREVPGKGKGRAI